MGRISAGKDAGTPRTHSIASPSVMPAACARLIPRTWGWRAAFVLGLLLAPLLWQGFAPLPEMRLPSNPWLIAAAGLLVGFGTRLGSGCTSGHGVCGIARLSRRSLAATLTFMATGVATVYVLRHVFA